MKAIDALLDEALLSLDELCRAAAVDPHWVRQRVDAGLLAPPGDPADSNDSNDSSRWRFDAPALRRVRWMVTIERTFDADAELAGLVADLQQEIERLRQRLRRSGLD